eukprot:4972076-Pleurochrysis_carterae.AAC.1
MRTRACAHRHTYPRRNTHRHAEPRSLPPSPSLSPAFSAVLLSSFSFNLSSLLSPLTNSRSLPLCLSVSADGSPPLAFAAGQRRSLFTNARRHGRARGSAVKLNDQVR